MRIGLNATCFNARPSGARQRFVELYGELIKSRPDWEFVIFEAADAHISEFMSVPANAKVRRTTVPSSGKLKKLAMGARYWPGCMRNEEFDVFEQFNLPIVTGKFGLKLLTIHDVRALISGDVFRRVAYKNYTSRSIRSADKVITVSHTMKEELLSHFPNTDVQVIYNGVDAHAFDRISEEQLHTARQSLALPSEFLLTIGHMEPRKNQCRLVEALAKVPDAPPLVIVGNDSGQGKQLSALIRRLSLENRVLIRSGLSDDEVKCVYKLCTAFVFPSLYEGFGIPLLEAMAARKPVASSSIPVFKEITQGRGLYFAPDNSEDIAESLRRLLENSGIQRDQVEYGAIRVKEFDFTRLADDLARIYAA